MNTNYFNIHDISLSIIIPHYNSTESLKLLLKSIGTHSDVEVIVVDDKSTIEWKNLITEYPDVHFVENKTANKGPGVARNIGLDLAKGKWILFADSDDILIENWYETLQNYFSLDEDIIFLPPESVDERTGERNTSRGQWYKSLCENFVESGNDELLRTKFSSPCSKILKASLIREHNIRFPEIMHWEDSMFSANTGYFAKSVTAKMTPIYCIIDHNGSMTTINTKDAYEIRMKVLAEQYRFWKEKKRFTQTLKILKKDCYNMLLKGHYFGFFYMMKCTHKMIREGIPVSYTHLLLLSAKKIIRKALKVINVYK